jgi:hypothetical protein
MMTDRAAELKVMIEDLQREISEDEDRIGKDDNDGEVSWEEFESQQTLLFDLQEELRELTGE